MKLRTLDQNQAVCTYPQITNPYSRVRKLLPLLATFAVILIVVGLSSCSGYTTNASVGGTGGGGGNPGDPGAGVLSASSTNMSFGSVAVGSTGTQSVTVTNTGTSAVNITAAVITGAAFTVVGGNPASSIPVGQSVTVQIQFAPTAAGAVTGTFTVTSDASNTPLAISLSGTGTQPVLTISPASLNFSNVPVGTTSTQTVTLTNSGNSDLKVNLATLTGTGFGMSSLGLPKTITAGQNLSFTVQFSPTSTTGASGSIVFTDNAPGSPQTLTLTGSAVATGSTLGATPGSFNFNSVVVNASSPQSFTLTNSGNATITINQITTTGPGFSSSGLTPGQTIAAGATATFTGTFAPTTTGAVSGNIAITSTATNPTLNIPLSGTGTQGGLTATPGSIPFGSVTVGASASVPVTLSNTGTAAVSITAHSITGTGFTLTGWTAPASLNPGQTTSFTVTFAPTSATAASGSVSITSNAPGSPLIINLTGSGTATQAQMTISPATVAFSNVNVGGNLTQNVTLTNTGNAALNITAASITGTGYTMNLTAPRTINAGANSIFTVTFTPTSAGSAPGSISITSNAPGSPATIALTGTGVQAQISASPTSVAFPNVVVGNNNSQPVTLHNNGNATLTFSNITVTGTGMTITGLTTASTIAAGGSLTFNAIFTPTSTATINGSIKLTTNGTPSPLTINVSGTGTAAQAQMTISPSPVAFNNVNVGSNLTQNVTLTNTGTAALNITAASITGTGYTMNLTAPKTINAGANSIFTVTFTPTSAGSTPGSISITSNAPGSPATIPLTGTGIQAQIAASPTSVAFANVVVGNSNSQPVTLRNNGNATLTFSNITVTGTGMTITGLTTSTTIAAGGNMTFNAVFTPTSTATINGTIKLTTNGTPSPLTINVSGTGIAATRILAASPTSLSFGTVNVNNSSQLSATLTNNGNSNITVSGVTVTGAGFSASGVSNGTMLTPGQSATLTVTFAPTTPGAVNGASVSVASNATGSPTAIALSGTGQSASSHSVALTWNTSPTSGINGYNVFRGTASGAEGTTPLNSSPISGLTYTDTTVVSGQTYFYVVTAVNSAGNSVPSNEVPASIP